MRKLRGVGLGLLGLLVLAGQQIVVGFAELSGSVVVGAGQLLHRVDDVTTHLSEIPEVIESHTMTGPGDLHCRLVARSNQIVRRRTRIKNEVHAVLHAHLIPPCPHANIIGVSGRRWLRQQVLPDDERQAIEGCLRQRPFQREPFLVSPC